MSISLKLFSFNSPQQGETYRVEVTNKRTGKKLFVEKSGAAFGPGVSPFASMIKELEDNNWKL